jgi:type VI secretion system protein ImpH
MADDGRPASYTVTSALQQDPYRFDLFQAIRGLECLYRDKPRLGRALRAADDPIRLGQEPSLAFAASTLASFEPGKDGMPGRLVVRSFGLLGPNGPLPLHLTEFARNRMRDFGDPTFMRFLDLFHHRLMSLFYRAWASAQPTVNFDRHLDDFEADRYAFYVGSMSGSAMASLRGRDAVSDLTKLHYTGRLMCQTHPSEGLRAMLADYFAMPTAIEEFVGEWIELPELYRCRLGESPATGALGRTAIVGTRAWDCQQKFRVALGPLSLKDYRRLLPGGEALERLVALVRLYAGDELDWDLKLVLKREQVPMLRLGAGQQLGRTTWLASRPAARDPEVVLHPLALAG